MLATPFFSRLGFAALLSIILPQNAVAYDLLKDYSGITFFDEFDFYGSWDNLTLGDVWWLNRADAFSQNLAYINTAGNAVIRVDNTTNVPMNEKRNSVRITTKAEHAVGSLWIIDLVHLPFGCSVWPAWWSLGGPHWPEGGEIDIIEGINQLPSNQMALHTTPGCTHAANASQTGFTAESDCSLPSGCLIGETKENSYRQGFRAAGGGVWATQFDVKGIFIWFWSRANVPASIAYSTKTSAIADISDWGPPSASYPSTTCDITKFFSPQKLILDITLCGAWAGLPQTYGQACASQGPTGLCYNDNVVGSGANYADAYFEVRNIRTYTTGGIAPTPTALGVTSDDTNNPYTGSGSSVYSALNQPPASTISLLPTRLAAPSPFFSSGSSSNTRPGTPANDASLKGKGGTFALVVVVSVSVGALWTLL